MLRRTLLAQTAMGLAAAAALRPALAQTPITLTVMHCWPAHARFHQPIADAFTAANPSIKISFRTAPPTYDDGHQQVLREAVTNQMPDVFYSGYHLMPQLARALTRRRQLVDLSPMIAAEGEDWLMENYAPRMFSLGAVDGRQVGMPFNASSPIIYMNADLVRRAGGNPDAFPATWNETIALAGKIKAGGGDINGMAYDVHAWPDDWLWQTLNFQQGATLTDPTDETKVIFGGAAGLEALKLASRFVTEGGMAIQGFDQSRQSFVAGKTGIYINSPANLTGITESIGRSFELRTAKFPIQDPVKGWLPTGGNAGMILTPDALRQKAAWEFLKFVSGAEGQKMAVLATGYLPTNIKALGEAYLAPFYREKPNYRTPVDQYDRSGIWYGYHGTNGVKIWRLQRDLITLVMRGDTAPDKALAEMVAETQKLIPAA